MRCLNVPMFECSYIGIQTSAPTEGADGAEVSIFQVAEVPTNMYNYTLPFKALRSLSLRPLGYNHNIYEQMHCALNVSLYFSAV